MVNSTLDFFLLLFYLLMVPTLAAFFLWLSNEWYYQSMGRNRLKGILITGLIGTPIHEASHLMCVLLFGMRVKDVAFYKPDFESGSLGYVIYSYNPKSILHQIGRVVVGLSPLIAGSVAVSALFHYAKFPQLSQFVSSDISAFHWNGIFQWVSVCFKEIDTWQDLLVLTLASMIGAHATPSRADMEGSAKGAIPILLLLLIAYVLLINYSVDFSGATGWFLGHMNILGVAVLQVALVSFFVSIGLGIIGKVLMRLN